jgi:hypothetical protein
LVRSIECFRSEHSTEQSDFVDENGIRTTVEYAINDEGKKVKVSGRFFPFPFCIVELPTDHAPHQTHAAKIGGGTYRRRKEEMGQVWAGERK